MILRKPYAFLIKNFKLIHLILAILMGLFFSKLRSIAEFFKNYIDEGIYGQVFNAVSDNVGAFGIILPLIIIGVIILIAYILHMKQKPIRFYIVSVIAFILVIVLLKLFILLVIRKMQLLFILEKKISCFVVILSLKIVSVDVI